MGHARLAAAGLVGALLLAGCSDGGGGQDQGQHLSPQPTLPHSPTASATPSEPPVRPVRFNDCTEVVRPQIKDQPGGDRHLSFGCGTMQVPLDHDDPDGEKIKLFLVRVRLEEQKQRIGSLVINPGGPGGSGLDAAVGLGLQIPTEVLQRFDLVGFDPRGVGLSNPVRCISDETKDRIVAADPDARTAQEFDEQVRLAQQVAKDCSDKYGGRLAHFNTVETVRDMDLIRRALGDDKLNYLGFSYGTLLGAVYAKLYGQNARALALDGAVDPAQDVLQATEAQAKGFENAFDQFAAACRSKGADCPLNPDPRAFVTRLMAKARTTPIASRKKGEKRRATGGNVQLAVISALYDRDQWPNLSRALSEADHGDAQGILALDDQYSQRDGEGQYTNILDANITVSCNDTDQRISTDTIRAKLAEWRRKYPMFGASQALSLLTCQAWQPERHPYPKVTGATARSVLVVGTVHDPATPYSAAQALSRELGSGALLTWQGDGHTAYPKTRCVSDAVDRYLISLTVPKKGTTCPSG
jgi:pimeloyl-ACP methyl ester carboxylesterase